MRHVTVYFTSDGRYFTGIPHDADQCWPGHPDYQHTIPTVPVNENDEPDEAAVRRLMAGLEV
jgi:hypothetical protein